MKHRILIALALFAITFPSYAMDQNSDSEGSDAIPFREWLMDQIESNETINAAYNFLGRFWVYYLCQGVEDDGDNSCNLISATVGLFEVCCPQSAIDLVISMEGHNQSQ